MFASDRVALCLALLVRKWVRRAVDAETGFEVLEANRHRFKPLKGKTGLAWSWRSGPIELKIRHPSQ